MHVSAVLFGGLLLQQYSMSRVPLAVRLPSLLSHVVCVLSRVPFAVRLPFLLSHVVRIASRVPFAVRLLLLPFHVLNALLSMSDFARMSTS